MSTVGDVVAIAIGAVLLSFGGVLVVGMVRSLRDGQRLRRMGASSFIGGLRYHATGGIGSGARYGATWPFARLDVGVDQVTISFSQDLAFLVRHIPRRTSLRSDEVRHVEPGFGPLSLGLRFRTVDPADERDGTVFWMTLGDRERVVQLVAAAGFPLA
jgi:hypothetical protein